MEVPFHASGASSRRHYVLVRKVESEILQANADQHVLSEFRSIKHRFHEVSTLVRLSRLGNKIRADHTLERNQGAPNHSTILL
jgi:hypothetical protein